VRSVGKAKVSGMEVSVGTERCQPIVESKRLPCDLCEHPMEPEHAHMKCPTCGYILPCCGW
jgi:hypothetical protein